MLVRSVATPKAPCHLQLESTLEILLAVPALNPCVVDSVTISRGFFAHRKLRQTFEVNEARTVPAAGTSPHEFCRFPVSFKANVTKKLPLEPVRRPFPSERRVEAPDPSNRRACGVSSSVSGTPGSNKSTPCIWYSARPWRSLRRPSIPRSGDSSSAQAQHSSQWRVPIALMSQVYRSRFPVPLTSKIGTKLSSLVRRGVQLRAESS